MLTPLHMGATHTKPGSGNKLNGRITTDVREAGKTGYPSGAFDYVVGFAILHHMTMCLPSVLEEIGRVLAPDGAAVFLEPVARSPLLRWLRKRTPVKDYGTDDERQLNDADLALLRQYFGTVEYWHFRFLARLGRIFGARIGLLLLPVDYHVVRLFPFLSRFYGVVVVRLTNPVRAQNSGIDFRRDVLLTGTLCTLFSVAYVYVTILLLNRVVA